MHPGVELWMATVLQVLEYVVLSRKLNFKMMEEWNQHIAPCPMVPIISKDINASPIFGYTIVHFC